MTTRMKLKKSMNAGLFESDSPIEIDIDDPFNSLLNQLYAMLIYTESNTTIMDFCGVINRILGSKVYTCSDPNCGGRHLNETEFKPNTGSRDPLSSQKIELLGWIMAMALAANNAKQLPRIIAIERKKKEERRDKKGKKNTEEDKVGEGGDEDDESNVDNEDDEDD
ncbi:hypothetical protein HDU79_002404, partial [Rhizoclosmatium sp. JEL0117]